MNEYITEAMATVGCGASDVRQAQSDCDAMTKDERDILDCWASNGFNVELLPEYQKTAEQLKERYTEDDLEVLTTYVSARRNVEEY